LDVIHYGEEVAVQARGYQPQHYVLRRVLMPKYLLEASYTAEGTKGLVKEGGSSRRKKVEEMVKELHGKLEAFYYAFGTSDVFLMSMCRMR
jgi:uncharacterized protein with GYD domain